MKNKYKHLNSAQRYPISQMLKQGYSLRSIAQTIRVSASTVSLEVKRNSSGGHYHSKKAEHLMSERQSYRKYHRTFAQEHR